MVLNVIVVGGGVAGLATAVGLRQADHNVKIFEKSAFAAETGAAVAVAPNGAKVLARLGFSFTAARADELQVWDTVSGITMEKMASVDQSKNKVKWGFPMMSIHRVDMHNELLRALSECSPNGTLQLSSAVTNIDAQHGTVSLSDGTTHTADLIISADGLHSVARRLLVRENPAKRSGLSAFRFLIPTEALEADSAASETLRNKTKGSTIYADTSSTDERHIIWYSCRNGVYQNLAGIHPDRVTRSGSVPEVGQDRKELADEFGHFHPNLTNLIEFAESVKCWPLAQAEALSTWTYGKVVLIGDSAHPMLPFGGQGANQALEDAGALSYLLQGAEIWDLAARLKLFEAVRVKRASRTQTLSSVRAGLEYKVEDKLRHLADSPDAPVPKTMSERVNHDFGFDVYQSCEEVLQASKPLSVT